MTARRLRHVLESQRDSQTLFRWCQSCVPSFAVVFVGPLPASGTPPLGGQTALEQMSFPLPLFSAHGAHTVAFSKPTVLVIIVCVFIAVVGFLDLVDVK